MPSRYGSSKPIYSDLAACLRLKYFGHEKMFRSEFRYPKLAPIKTNISKLERVLDDTGGTYSQLHERGGVRQSKAQRKGGTEIQKKFRSKHVSDRAWYNIR